MTTVRPVTAKTENGAFELQLVAVDRLAAHKVEPWRLVWRGPPAQLFWNLREDALTPGTALEVRTSHVRAMRFGYHAEIVALVDSLAIAPQRAHSIDASLSTTEQTA